MWNGLDWNGLGLNRIDKRENWENRCWREERLSNVDGVGKVLRKDCCLLLWRFRAFCSRLRCRGGSRGVGGG